MVTLRTTSLTFKNSTFCQHSVFMCSVPISNIQRLFPYSELKRARRYQKLQRKALTALSAALAMNLPLRQPGRNEFTVRFELDLYMQFRLILVFTQCVSIRATVSTIRCITSRVNIRNVCWHIMHMYIDVSENLLPKSSVQKGHNLKATLCQTTRRHVAQHCLLVP